MKYARVERERRFLLRDVPADLPETWNLVTDWYLRGTRLRLRQVESAGGNVVARKLTQKFSSAEDSPDKTTITNFYLNEAEFDLLRTLGGSQVRKKRYQYATNASQLVIDVFEDVLDGLILAEVEFQDDQSMSAFEQPDFAVAEVTAVDFFTVGNLAGVESADLKIELAKWLDK